MMNPHKNRPTTPKPSSSPAGGPGVARRLALLALMGLTGLAACGEPEQVAPPSPHDFEIQVAVFDENEQPVTKAPVILDGSIVGFTDRDGIYQATLTEFVGTDVHVKIGELEGYVTPESAETTTTLKRVKTIDGFSNSPVRLQTSIESIRNDYLIWVDLECSEEVDAKHCQDLPVKLNDEEVARTDDKGRAHFDFRGIPEQVVNVKIDTPVYIPKQGDKPDDVFNLTPSDLSYEVTLGLNSEVLSIKEKLTDPAAAERIAAKKSRQRAAARRRAAQNRKASKKKAAEKAKADGVIDLW